jgi:PhnB protein
MATQSSAIPAGYTTVTPVFTFKDSVRAIEFYQAALDAKVLDRLPYPDGQGTMHAVMKIGNSILMMGDEMPEPNCLRSAEAMGGSPISLYVYVENVDEAFERALGAGASVTMPIADMFWGDRCGAFNDPFGYSWTIATHVKDLAPDEIAKGAKECFASMSK